MSNRNRMRMSRTAIVQVLFAGAFTTGWMLLPENSQQRIRAEVQFERPLADIELKNNAPVHIEPLYDDPTVVSDEELAAVLTKILPRFSRSKLKPNYVEHAARVWGSTIEFNEPELISGPDMRDYLLDTGQYIASWGDKHEPILEPNNHGITVRWGPYGELSVHHDHMLASLAEAGVALDTPVFTTSRRMTVQQVLSESLRDFRLDERETEWSTMAFAMYLAPQGTTSWHNSEGRRISFEMLANRLMRNHRQHGVCLGTHRIYALMMLLRLDEEHADLLSDDMHVRITEYLHGVTTLITAAQYENGMWPSNWPDGAEAKANEDPKELIKKKVIATGHHLEWLAIAPPPLHPPREQVRKAADWIIRNTLETPQDVIDANYTFYSHVGNALATWRKTSAAEFWVKWRDSHPDAEVLATADDAPQESSYDKDPE